MSPGVGSFVNDSAAALMTLTGPMMVGAGVASAVDMLVPMSQYLRRCDFSTIKNIGGAY